MVDKIYTRTGDKGETTARGERVSKSSDIIAAIGDVDELNSVIGMCKVDFDGPIKADLERVQSNLLEIGAILSGNEKEFGSGKIKALEEKIDRYTEVLPPLTSFILPEGNLHFARAVCRRVERSIVRVTKNEAVLAYLNRLSDFLFVLARYANSLKGAEEKTWKHGV
jgi:cob(I)alamin adenosyltransferase